MEEVKESKSTISFWDNNHPLSAELSRMWDLYVPASGNAETVHGELVRCASRLFHEYCNNGNCNAIEVEELTCSSCGGSGYQAAWDEEDEDEDCSYCGGDCVEEGDRTVSEFYQEMLEFIQNHVPNSNTLCYNVSQLITDNYLNYNYKYNQEEMDVYNALSEVCVLKALELEKESKNN